MHINESLFHDDVLLIIESPGKVSRVNELMVEAGFTSFTVFPTSGRLFDLPRDSMGVDLSNLERFDRTPINKDRIIKLSSEISSKVIIVMTDNDFEGELIASDIFDISIRLGRSIGKNLFRVKIDSLSIESFLNALKNPSGIDNDLVKGALARRAFDRLSGFSISSHDYSSYKGNLHGSVGRILTPALSLLATENKNSGDYGYLKVVDGNGKEWVVELRHPDKKLLINACEKLSSIEPPQIKEVDSLVYDDIALPMNGGDALYQISRATKSRVVDVAGSLQRLYQQGKISYPRTDSRLVHNVDAMVVARESNEYGVRGFDAEFLVGKSAGIDNRKTQGAHHAIIPHGVVSSLYMDHKSLSLDDLSLMLIWRNIIRAGQVGRKIEEHVGELVFSYENAVAWERYIDDGMSISARRFESYIEGSPFKRPMNDSVNPLGVDCTTKLSPASGYCTENNDLRVLRLLIENNLGRPSTYAYHSEKISSKYLDGNGDVNSLGMSSVLLSSYYCSGLKDPVLAAKIEDILHFGEFDISTNIKNAIELAGINMNIIGGDPRVFDFADEDQFIL